MVKSLRDFFWWRFFHDEHSRHPILDVADPTWGTIISHLGKRKIIFKSALVRNMLLPRRVTIKVYFLTSRRQTDTQSPHIWLNYISEPCLVFQPKTWLCLQDPVFFSVFFVGGWCPMIRAIYTGCVFSWWNTTQGGETVWGNMVFHGFFPCQDDSFGIFFRAPNFSYEKMTILLLWIVFFPYLKPKKAVSNKWFLCGEVGPGLGWCAWNSWSGWNGHLTKTLGDPSLPQECMPQVTVVKGFFGSYFPCLWCHSGADGNPSWLVGRSNVHCYYIKRNQRLREASHSYGLLSGGGGYV